MNPRSEEDFCIYRADTNPIKNHVNFTPSSEKKSFSQRTYDPLCIKSKTVPRRKSGATTKTNRSLNFDIGKKTYNQLQNSNSSLTSKQLSTTRSAKMLKFLEVDINKLNNNNNKINKTLNFDSSPSPKRLSINNNNNNISNKSKHNISNLTLDSPGIIKTLQYDSSSETSEASPMDISNESIDENQNKTPSSNKKAKKSLNYSSQSSNGKSSDFSVLSPGLRTELREKIDNIIQDNHLTTPKFINNHINSNNNNNNNKISDNIVVSTPRNLFNNYSDDDDDDDDNINGNKKMKGKKNVTDEIVKDVKEGENDDEESPETPKNTICVVPESMSAIKKSHRKERVNGRLLKLEKNNIDKSFKMDIDSDDNVNDNKKQIKKSTTPECEKLKNSYDSIKKSHKKNRENKNKSCSIDSDDDLSETGSLFDYSIEKLNDNDINDNNNLVNNKTNIIPKIIIQDETNKTTTSSNNTTTTTTTTPENKIDYLRRIMTDSIKKSHKKIKDLNKKSLFKPRTLNNNLDDDNIDNNNDDIINDNKNRSCTPENMNSSRLLLDKFNSVKKSHKKDKNRIACCSQRQSNNNINTLKISDNLGTSLLDDNEPKPLCTSPNKRKNNNENLEISSSSGSWKIEDESNNEEFTIFSPLKKKKPIKITKTTTTIDDTKLSSDESIEIGRCETPKLSQLDNHDDDDNDDDNNNFKTPIKSKKINNNNDDNDDDDSNSNDDTNNGQVDDINGRLTPENQALHPHITGLSSIKKSHKKNKWTNSTKRTSYLLKKFIDIKNDNDSPIKNNNNNNNNKTNWRTNIDNQSSSDSTDKCDYENNSSNNTSSPKASTSYISDNNSPVKTPPNTLETKTYLRLLQTTSIKRSHKKMRDKKKQESILFDPDLSDDGSIFDDTEKNNSIDLDNYDCLPLEGDDNNEKITCSKRRCSSGNKSDDGSIFGSDTEQQETPRRRNVKMVKNDTSRI